MRSTFHAAVSAVLLSISFAASAAPMPEARRLHSIDVFQLEYADDVQISPDGSHIVYVRVSHDIMTDRVRRNLWMIDADGANNRPLRSENRSFSSPRWSPDGTRLAYVSAAEGSPQLYVRWMDSGQTALLTNLTEAPGSIAWSPDGKSIAFTQFVHAEKEPLAIPPRKPEGASWAPPVKVVDSVTYRIDGAGYLEAGFQHVFIVSAEGGTARQLTDGDFNDDGPLSFTPDGRQIYFSANRGPDWELDPQNTEVFSVDIGTLKLTQLTSRKGPDASPVVSPDGRKIAYLGFDDRFQGYQVTHLYVMDVGGGNPRAIGADFDRDVADPQWSADSRGLYFTYDDRGVRKLGYVTLDGKVRTLAEGIGGTDLGRPYTSGSFSVARNGRAAFVHNTPQRPADVATATLAGSKKGGAARVLTSLNDDLLGIKTLGAVRELSWTSKDQRKIQGWVITPPDFDAAKKYPLILEIHGGPFAAYGPNYATELQLYAAAGYMVLYANPRGSTSYGEEFGNLIHHAYPGDDYFDLMSGVDALIAEGHVDAGNLFVTGGSGGGVLTAWIVGKTDRFRAAVVAKPVINWSSFVLTSDFNNFFSKYWFGAMPWEEPQEYWRRSPLSLVGNVKTPTMLITGEADYRTPIEESEQYYQALKLRRIDTVMVRIPEASHGGMVSRPSNLIAKVDNILAWFGKYRKK
ncbi:MAG TPA: S9 family peptidase [Steroidobacteraceae bacterium]|jgi:dipeptidyl aminopeptidase/acylaminoacyl peptidase|nr:S9 family peptidase [Steroidobacteraceae bacterium]